MNYRSNLNRLWIILAILVIGIVGGLTWANYQYAMNNPGGNDFLVHWMGTRQLLTKGISPYSDDTALMIQKFVYGRPAQAGEHELRVAYPLYSVVIFSPFALIPKYNLARAVWMTVLEIALILLGYVSIRLSNWKPGLWVLALYFIFGLFWYHALRPLINGNVIILIALGVAGALLAMRNGADELAGVLLALTTIKPHNVVIIILFILLFALRMRRWRLIGWFFITLFLLILSSILLIPDWIMQNIREVIRYTSYNPPGTLGTALIAMLPGLGTRVKWAISFILALILLVEWGQVGRSEFRGFYWKACITLVISQWIGIQTDPGNFILLFPALPLIFSLWGERWKRAGQLFTIGSLFLLFAGIWIIFLNTLQPGYQPQQSPIMFIPLPLFLFVTLYWVRWWAFHPQNIWMDEMTALENSRYT